MGKLANFISEDGSNFTIPGNLTVNGNLNVQGPSTVNGNLNVQGLSTVNNNEVITYDKDFKLKISSGYGHNLNYTYSGNGYLSSFPISKWTGNNNHSHPILTMHPYEANESFTSFKITK